MKTSTKLTGALLVALVLRNPDVTAATLSTLIGIGIILNGVGYIVADAGVSRLETRNAIN
ncbi:MAG: hypothetical protein J6M31_08905 [Bacteroidales bacterium]|nr:hypothetical protein [Bacteroidales bacterium]